MSNWLVTVICMTGCASQLHTLDPSWDGSSEPDCTDSDGAVVGDALASEAGLRIAHKGHGGAGFLAGLAGLGFAIASDIGAEQVARCREAKAEWRIGNAAGAAARQREPRDEPAPPPPPPPPRGYFCTASATHVELGRCTRDRDTCEQAHALAVEAIPDLSACTLVETATCFAGTCYPSAAACAAHRGPDSVGNCTERP